MRLRNTMDSYRQLSALLDLAEEIGLSVRVMPSQGDTLDHPGGACVRIGKQEILFLDPEASVADRLSVAAHALTGRPELEGRFLPPELRELLDRCRRSGDTP